MNDRSNLGADTPKSQFEVFKLYATLSKNFMIPKTKIPILLST